MSLRVVKPTTKLAGRVDDAAPPPEAGDNWMTRLAKLIPAEALGLYGAASGAIPATAPDRQTALWIVAGVSLLFCAAIRYFATRGSDGKPQWVALAIALISFVVWLQAIGPTSPIHWTAGYEYWATLIAVLWAGIVSFFYKGD